MSTPLALAAVAALAAAAELSKRGSRSTHPHRLRLYHGGRDWVPRPRPGTFFSSRVEGALDYARYGSNQQQRNPDWGVMSTFALSPSARIQRFPSFSAAYRHYGVHSTSALARAATRRGEADVVQMLDEHIVIDPSVLSYLGFNLVHPASGKVRGDNVAQVLRGLNESFAQEQGAQCAWDINNGLCEEWAEDARERLGGGASFDFANFQDDMLEAEGIEPAIEDEWSRWHPISHAVLSYEGRWHDAQHPEGVDTLSELDIVRKVSRQDFLRGQGSRNEAWTIPDRITVEVAPVGERDTIDRVFGRRDPVFTIRTTDGQEAVVRGWDLGNHAEVYDALWNERGRELRGEALRAELSRFAQWLESQDWPMEVFRGTRTEVPVGSPRDVSEQQGPHRGEHWTPMYGVAYRFATGQHDAAPKSAGRHGQLYSAKLDDLDIVDWPATVYYFYRYTDTKRPVGWSNRFDPEHEVKIKGYRHLPVVVLQQTV